jgi:hypothetical protein
MRSVMPVALGTTYYLFLRPQMLSAGTRPGEAARSLPGDDMIANPNFQATRAIDIDAPPETVWPWIEQMGRDHTGFYGLDSLTNHSLPSAAYLRQDLPALQSGMALDSGYRVLAMEPNRLFLYGGFDLTTPIGSPLEFTTLILLEERQNGGTRLLVWTRGYTYGVLAPLYNLIYEIVDFVQGMAQLENIRQRAETVAHLRGRAAS